jgi:hypothetical protein
VVETNLEAAFGRTFQSFGLLLSDSRIQRCYSRESQRAASSSCSVSRFYVSISSPYQFAVPLSRTDCVPAPSCTIIVALFAPVVLDAPGATPGANVTLIVQLAPIAMVEVQLLV